MRDLLVGLLVLTAAAPATVAANPRAAAYGYVVERVGSGAANLSLSVESQVVNGGFALVAVATATVDRRGHFTDARPVYSGGLTVRDWPYAATSLPPAPPREVTCATAPPVTSCSAALGDGRVTVVAGFTGAQFNRVLVATHGTTSKITLGEGDRRRWRVRRWPGRLDVVENGGEADAQVSHLNRVVFMGPATARGDRAGSLAMGHLPCSSTVEDGGFGEGRLRDGVRTGAEVTTQCWRPEPSAVPPVRRVYGPLLWSDRAAEWSFSGVSTGPSDVPVQLIVFNRKA